MLWGAKEKAQSWEKYVSLPPSNGPVRTFSKTATKKIRLRQTKNLNRSDFRLSCFLSPRKTNHQWVKKQKDWDETLDHLCSPSLSPHTHLHALTLATSHHTRTHTRSLSLESRVVSKNLRLMANRYNYTSAFPCCQPELGIQSVIGATTTYREITITFIAVGHAPLCNVQLETSLTDHRKLF